MCSIDLGDLVWIAVLDRGQKQHREKLSIRQPGFDFPGEGRNALFA